MFESLLGGGSYGSDRSNRESLLDDQSDMDVLMKLAIVAKISTSEIFEREINSADTTGIVL